LIEKPLANQVPHQAHGADITNTFSGSHVDWLPAIITANQR
jgi:hypothetical protein